MQRLITLALAIFEGEENTKKYEIEVGRSRGCFKKLGWSIVDK